MALWFFWIPAGRHVTAVWVWAASRKTVVCWLSSSQCWHRRSIDPRRLMNLFVSNCQPLRKIFPWIAFVMRGRRQPLRAEVSGRTRFRRLIGTLSSEVSDIRLLLWGGSRYWYDPGKMFQELSMTVGGNSRSTTEFADSFHRKVKQIFKLSEESTLLSNTLESFFCLCWLLSDCMRPFSSSGFAIMGTCFRVAGVLLFRPDHLLCPSNREETTVRPLPKLTWSVQTRSSTTTPSVRSKNSHLFPH